MLTLSYLWTTNVLKKIILVFCETEYSSTTSDHKQNTELYEATLWAHCNPSIAVSQWKLLHTPLIWKAFCLLYSSLFQRHINYTILHWHSFYKSSCGCLEHKQSGLFILLFFSLKMHLEEKLKLYWESTYCLIKIQITGKDRWQKHKFGGFICLYERLELFTVCYSE